MGIYGNFSLKQPGAKTGTYKYFDAVGEFVCKVKKLMFIDVSTGPLFVAEFEVVDSGNEAIKVGEDRNWTAPTGTKWGPGNIAECIMACAGEDPMSPEAYASRDWNDEGKAATTKGKFDGNLVLVSVVSRLNKNKPDLPENRRNIATFFPYM